MRIASKINAALFVAFACGTIATFWVLQSTIWPRFAEIERSMALMNQKRVTDAFRTFTEKLQTATQDYAFWDESYRFMQGDGVDEFISSNLTPEFKAVENLGLNVLVFLNSNGSVRWGAAYNLETKEPLEGIVSEIAHFSRSHPYLGLSKPEAERGLIQTKSGLMLVAISPVLKSDQSGPAVGKVISAKLLDPEAAKQLTGVNFTIEAPNHWYDFQSLSNDTTVTTLKDVVKTTSVLKSVIGRPIAILTSYTPRDVGQAGAAAIRSATLMMIAVGILSVGVLWAFFRAEVVRRIEALTSHFATAGTSGTIKSTPAVASGDEIGELARSFNGMADQVNHLRDALADSAFMSGLSEWAAGTLHNVRNGMAPLTATTWKIEQLFDPAWIANLDRAVTELSDPQATDARRQKLNSYLVGCAARFSEVARRTTEMTSQINDASKSILDMAGEFERYAHRTNCVEEVDLSSCLRLVATTTTGVHSKHIELYLPSAPVMVESNSIILRQIFSNVFVNAIEAMEDQERPRRIEVAIGSGPDEATRIAITDNGVGISAEKLPAIFQRGQSTRTARPGGLGLHWCANAVKVLGGSIKAESKGIGHGTTITIDLPSKKLCKEAA